MMNLVNVLVKPGAYVHETMAPVVPCVLHDEKDGNLVGHLEQAWEGNRCLEAEVDAHGVE